LSLIRYRLLLDGRREIKEAFHKNDGMGEYSILASKSVDELSTTMPMSVAELEQITYIGNAKAKKYPLVPLLSLSL
jgi:HRDC domain